MEEKATKPLLKAIEMAIIVSNCTNIMYKYAAADIKSM